MARGDAHSRQEAAQDDGINDVLFSEARAHQNLKHGANDQGDGSRCSRPSGWFPGRCGGGADTFDGGHMR